MAASETGDDPGADTTLPSSPKSPRTALALLRAIPEPDLSVLAKPKKKKQKPGQWDGRVGNLTLQEYRERKWGTEAGLRMTTRSGGPKFTIRGRIMEKSASGPNVLLKNDVWKGYYATQPSIPSYSIGRRPVACGEPEKSPGPLQYPLRGIVGSSSHPTIGKDHGRKFGTERLLANDEAGPAPGDYDTAGFEKTGRYIRSCVPVIQGREAWREPPVAPGPGAGDYNFDDVFRNGKQRGTSYTLQNRVSTSQPATGTAGILRKRLDGIVQDHAFEKEIDFTLISQLLLTLDVPRQMEVCKELEDHASEKAVAADPNKFLTVAALKHLGSGGGYNARKPRTPGPGHYGDPGAGRHAKGGGAHGCRFNREHRGLVT